MKKIILLAAVTFVSCSISFAQGNQLSPKAEEECQKLTREMANALLLNEAAYIKVKALNVDHYLKKEELMKAYSSNESILSAKLQELNNEFEKAILPLLKSKQQLEAYNLYKQQNSSN